MIRVYIGITTVPGSGLEDKMKINWSLLQRPKKERLAEAHTALEGLDYKTIKNVEAYLLTLTAAKQAALPYNPQEVAAEKQPYRDTVNALEE